MAASQEPRHSSAPKPVSIATVPAVAPFILFISFKFDVNTLQGLQHDIVPNLTVLCRREDGTFQLTDVWWHHFVC